MSGRAHLLRRWARWILRDEIRAVTADLAIARADATDAILARDRIAYRMLNWAGRIDPGDCRKVPLHSPAECEAWADKVRENTASDDEFMPYQCSTCTHPLIGHVWHIAHADPQARGSSRSRHQARAGRALTVRISDERLAEIRARLTE